jgi:LmbE family N-acetylglucosaminyl deacetylase
MKILAIGAHADDLELACGGTLAKAVELGHEVKILVLTDSAYTNYDGSTLRTKGEADQEALAGAHALGVTDVEILDFPIKFVPYNGDTVQAINRVIDTFQPDVTMTHWAFDTHQDHKNTSQSTISAARYQNNLLMYEPFPPSGRSYMPFHPQMYFDISSVIDKKIAALREHKSQLAKYGENWVEAVVGRARLRGYESGHKYAEAFEVVRFNWDFRRF